MKKINGKTINKFNRIRLLINENIKKYSLALIFGGVVGCIIGVIITGYGKLPMAYQQTSSLANLIVVVLTYWFAVSIHELGHFFTFIKTGVKMRGIVILSLFIMKKEGKWKINFRPNNVTFVGGIAIPEIPSIKNEAEFLKMQKSFASALLAGPLSSIMLLITLIPSVYISVSSNNEMIKSVLLVYSISLVVITLFLLASCFIKNEHAVGDFPAYKLAKENSFFVAIQMYSYEIFREKEFEFGENEYLRQVLLEGLETKFKEDDYHIYTLAIIDTFLHEYLLRKISEVDEVILNYIKSISTDVSIRNKLYKTEGGQILIAHIIQYLKIHDIEKSDKIFSHYKTLNIKSKSYIYYKKQVEHFLGVEDQTLFLYNRENINRSMMHGLLKHFETYYKVEEDMNVIVLSNIWETVEGSND